jgi:Fur family ferric uptake transcriptional regulator
VVVEGLKSLFINHLKSKGLILTRQRARVFEEVLKAKGHFGAEDLCFRLGVSPEKVSRATVYRSLELLIGAGVVQRLRLSEDHVRFEIARVGAHHDHLICAVCGQVIEFYSEKIEGLQNEICDERGFSAAGHSLVIYGYCERCVDAAADVELTETRGLPDSMQRVEPNSGE